MTLGLTLQGPSLNLMTSLLEEVGLNKMEKSSDLYHNEEHKRGAVKMAVADDFQDLSLTHTSLGMFHSESPQLWNKFSLTDEQVDQYWEHGYLTNVPVLSNEQCDMILEDYKHFLNPDKLHPGHGLFYEFHRNQSGDSNNVLLHALGQWRITATFHDLCFLPSIVVPAAQLIHPSKQSQAIRLWHDQLFSKPPKCGGVVAWHQDYSYWTRTKPMSHITVHVALDDQTVETGGLHYVPGSHRWHRNGKALPITDASFGKMQSIQDILTEEEKVQFKPLPSGLKKGEASFHHPLMVHGSYANQSERPRRAAVVNFFTDGVYSDSDEPLLNGVPAVKKGEKLSGQFFPLVYDPAWLSS